MEDTGGMSETLDSVDILNALFFRCSIIFQYKCIYFMHHYVSFNKKDKILKL